MARAPHQRGGGPDLPAVEVGVSTDLRALLAAAKAYSPKLARKLRKALRASGEDIIAAQKKILDGPLPGKAVKVGRTVRRIKSKDGRKSYLRAVNVYRKEEASGNRSRGMREQVKRSLKTRVIAGKTRSGIQVRADRGIGGQMTKVWNKKIIRHPVFFDGSGEKEWISQFGQPYWWGPIKDNQQAARERAIAAVNETTAEIARMRG